MEGMPMPGGGAMATMWTRMPGQTWPGAAAAFLGMWTVMMVAMMLPSLVPMLYRYRAVVRRDGVARVGRLMTLVGAGYFAVWTVVGAAVFPLGIALSAAAVWSPIAGRMAPFAAGAVVLIAGALQLTPWKARRLAHRAPPARVGRSLAGDANMAWRHGVRLGIECAHCCVGLMAIPLVVGMMDVRVMAAVTAAITAERFAPTGVRVARLVGAGAVAGGLLLMVRAASLG
jgi:predicted metal-binding membrane protein